MKRLPVGVTGVGLSERRAVDASVRRVVAASVGLAVGIGVAVGAELRSALHRSAGVAAGFLSTFPQRRASVREQDASDPGTDAGTGRKRMGSPTPFLYVRCMLTASLTAGTGWRLALAGSKKVTCPPG